MLVISYAVPLLGPGSDTHQPTPVERRDGGFPVALHRVGTDGGAVFTYLALPGESPGEARVVPLSAPGCDAVGLEFAATPVRDASVVIALRPGIATHDDELVTQLLSFPTGERLWSLTPPSSPRGQVALGVVTALHESRTELAVLPAVEVAPGVVRTDDTVEMWGEEPSAEEVSPFPRVRTWSSAWGFVVHEDGNHGDLGALVLAGDAGGVGHVLLSSDGSAHGVSSLWSDPVWAPTPLTDLDPGMQALLAVAAAEIDMTPDD